ncbi:MAG: 30S ribosomal protein S9, partial [Bacteroidota bacterium]
MDRINTIGRRKTSVARIYMSSGKGEITVNEKELNVYFPSEILQTIVKQPLVKVEQDGN